MPTILKTRAGGCITFILGLVLLAGMFLTPAAAAQDQVVIDSMTVDKTGVYPGETVRVTLKWTNNTGLVVAASVKCSGGSTSFSQAVKLGPSGTLRVDFPIDYSASPGNYDITVATGDRVLKSRAGAFRVNLIPVDVKDVKPSSSMPVEIYAGETVNISFNYTSPVKTRAEIAIGNLATKSIDLAGAGKFTKAGTSLQIPAGAPAGNYNLRLSFAGSETTVNQKNAVTVKKKPTTELNLISPTRSNPALVSPGEYITVNYNYTVDNDTPVYVRLTRDSGAALVSKEVTLTKGKTSGSTVLSIPSGATVGKYSLTVLPKSGTGTLDTELEAVIVDHRVTASINSPTRKKPVEVTAGDKLTINLEYTAEVKSSIEVRLQRDSGDVLLAGTVTLDRATSKKSRTVTATIPSNAAGGIYDLVLRSPASGVNLDQEIEAVKVDAKVNAELTSPTRSKVETVKSGGSLPVKFNYTSGADTSVNVQLVDRDGKVLVKTTASLSKTSTGKSKSVTVNIPSSAALGQYDVEIVSRYGEKVLDSETRAVTVEDAIKVDVQSPTATYPVRFNTTGKLEVKFKYAAATSGNVEFRLLKPDGRVLVSESKYLSKTSTLKTETVNMTLPPNTPVGDYDLEAVNKRTGNRVALEKDAVSVVSYPLNVQVKFVLGQNGRWVNNVFQPIDVQVMVVQNRTLLPIRHVGEPLGWELKWDESNKMATVIKGQRQVRVWLNNSNGKVSTDNGRTWQTVKIDPGNSSVQPLAVSGRVLLPLRFVSEALDTRVDWEGTTKTVTVSQ